MATIVDGNKIAQLILNKLKIKVRKLIKQGIKPKLGVIFIGDNKASQIYIRKKKEAAKKIGINFILYHYPATVSTKKLKEGINLIQKKKKLTGLIVQLPLPKKINQQEIVNQICPYIDVDCLSEYSLGLLVSGRNYFIPPTPGAILEVLNFYKIDLTGKHIVIIGPGTLIGRPLVNLLMHQKVTLTVCSSGTQDLKKYTKQGDIVISGVGKHHLIKGTMIKKGAVVIDAGICFEGAKMCGDIDFESVTKLASLVTPTPGGIGPITVAKLLENTILATSL